jgi:hypothetical protein
VVGKDGTAAGADDSDDGVDDAGGSRASDTVESADGDAAVLRAELVVVDEPRGGPDAPPAPVAGTLESDAGAAGPAGSDVAAGDGSVTSVEGLGGATGAGADETGGAEDAEDADDSQRGMPQRTRMKPDRTRFSRVSTAAHPNR